jgi:hypothetical protein
MSEHDRSDSAADAELVTGDEVHTGYLTGPGVDHLPVQYVVVDGIALFAGCIDLGPADQVAAAAERYEQEALASRSDPVHGEDAEAEATAPGMELLGVGLPTNSSFLWPNGRVAFTIDANLANQNRVTDAIAHIEARSAIRFVRRTAANASTLPNWVEFVHHATVNSSAVGMRGGRQEIRLSPNATMGTAVHEILHCLGIYHEQQRSDRDQFIEIRWQNIQQNAVGNFRTVPGAVDYYDYDYASIMHYPRWAFSTNNQDTIVPRQAGVTIGQRDGLSFGDRLTIAKLYERFFVRGHSGVWRAQTGRYGMWINATWASFLAKWQEWSNGGLRLVDIHTRQVGNETRYSGVFVAGSGAYGMWANANFAAFNAKRQEWAGQGLRLVGMHVHRVGNENRFSGAWLPGTGGYGLWANASWDSFRNIWEQWNGQGLRLVDLHVHRVNGQNLYSGAYLAGAGGYGLWANTNWDSFRAKWREWSDQGLRLVDLNIHRAGSQNRYSGVWRQGSGAYYLWANVTWESFRATWEELAGRGLRLVDYDFPSAEIGLLGDPGALSDATLGLLDPSLEQDGFGGLFEGEAAPSEPDVATVGHPDGGPVEAARRGEPVATAGDGRDAADDASGVGELVLTDERAADRDPAGASGGPDGEGDAVFQIPGDEAHDGDEVTAAGVGGSGGMPS